MDYFRNIILIGLAFIIIVWLCTTSTTEGYTEDSSLSAGAFNKDDTSSIPNITSQNYSHKTPESDLLYQQTATNYPNSATNKQATINNNEGMAFASKEALGPMTPETKTSYIKAGKIKDDSYKITCPNGEAPNQYGYCDQNDRKNSNTNADNYKTKYECELHGFNWDSNTFACTKTNGNKNLNPDKYTDEKSCTQAEFLWMPTLNKCLNKDDYENLQNKKAECAKEGKTIALSKSAEKPTGYCQHCPDDKRWSHTKKKCVSKDNDSENEDSSDSDSDNEDNGWFSKMMNKGRNTWEKAKKNELGYDPYVFEKVYKSNERPTGTYHPSAVVLKSQIPKGHEDEYVLKSQIVPPVCPACPPVISGGGCPTACKAKCAPCPRPPPIQPCPPCARCPEPAFTCKKVPDYSTPNIPSALPMPRLNSFSQFGQ